MTYQLNLTNTHLSWLDHKHRCKHNKKKLWQHMIAGMVRNITKCNRRKMLPSPHFYLSQTDPAFWTPHKALTETLALQNCHLWISLTTSPPCSEKSWLLTFLIYETCLWTLLPNCPRCQATNVKVTQSTHLKSDHFDNVLVGYWYSGTQTQQSHQSNHLTFNTAYFLPFQIVFAIFCFHSDSITHRVSQ